MVQQISKLVPTGLSRLVYIHDLDILKVNINLPTGRLSIKLLQSNCSSFKFFPGYENSRFVIKIFLNRIIQVESYFNRPTFGHACLS